MATWNSFAVHIDILYVMKQDSLLCCIGILDQEDDLPT